MPSATFRFRELGNTLTRNILEELALTGEIVGSWWLTVAVLLALGWVSHLSMKVSAIFYCILTFSIVVSMLVTAPLISFLSHRVSDEVFLGNYHRVAELTSGAIIYGTISSFLISFIPLICLSKLTLNLKVLTSTLTSFISLVWITGSIMSTIEKGVISLIGFLLGGAICLIPGLFLSFHPSISGLIVLVIIFFSLSSSFQYAYIVRGVSRGPIRPTLSLPSSRYFIEAIGAFFLTLGAWADKLVFWFHPKTAILVDPLLRYSCYDYPFFIAFTIASIGQFLVLRNQRELRDAYRAYVSGLKHNYNFYHFHLTKLRIIGEWQGSLYRLFYIYGTIIAVILLSVVTGVLTLPWKNPFIFHYLLAGTLFFMLFFFNLLIFQYFLKDKVYLFLSLLFFLLNTIGTFISIEKGPLFYGAGFLGASLFSALISILFLSPLLSRLEFETFREVADVF